MRVQEVILNCLNGLRESSLCRWGMHILTVLLLNILLTYFFNPSNQMYTLVLSVILWRITWEDLKTRLIDIRMVVALFIMGQFVLPDYYHLVSIFITVSVLAAGFALYEFSARKVRSDNGLGGDVFYNSPDSCINEDNAPPFVPLVLIGMVSLLTYYLMTWHLLSPSTEFMLFTPMPIELPIQLFLIPVVFLGFYKIMVQRHKKDMRNGFNIVYQVMGEGDIWTLAAIAGIFGFTFTCFTVIIAILLGLIWLANIRRGACNER